MDCIDLDKLGGAAPAVRPPAAANDNIDLSWPPGRARRSRQARARLQLLD